MDINIINILTNDREGKKHVLSEIRLTQTCGLAQEHPKGPQPVQARIKDKSLSRICDKAACIIRAISCPFIEGRMGALPTFGLAGSFRQLPAASGMLLLVSEMFSTSQHQLLCNGDAFNQKEKLTSGNESQTIDLLFQVSACFSMFQPHLRGFPTGICFFPPVSYAISYAIYSLLNPVGLQPRAPSHPIPGRAARTLRRSPNWPCRMSRCTSSTSRQYWAFSATISTFSSGWACKIRSPEAMQTWKRNDAKGHWEWKIPRKKKYNLSSTGNWLIYWLFDWLINRSINSVIG